MVNLDGTLPFPRMKRRQIAAPLGMLLAALMATVATLAAHPAPFSYVDVRVHPSATSAATTAATTSATSATDGEGAALDVTIAAHIFDLAHDLGIDPPDRLLDPAVLSQKSAAIAALMQNRLALDADGQSLTAGPWSAPEIVAGQQLIRLRTRYELAAVPGRIAVAARLFPYDPAHQTFVNVYQRDALASQQILDAGRPRFDYFTESRRGLRAIVSRFVSAGVARLLNGREHVLFLVGLLLLDGSSRQRALIVGAFAAALSVTLSLDAWNVLTPSMRIIGPAMALSVVYVGVDNLMMRGGRDVRVWIALAFGFIHGFGLADAWHGLDRARLRIAWSLYLVQRRRGTRGTAPRRGRAVGAVDGSSATRGRGACDRCGGIGRRGGGRHDLVHRAPFLSRSDLMTRESRRPR